MSTPAPTPSRLDGMHSARHQLYAILLLSTLAILPFLAWPGLRHRLLATNFLPHLYCCLSNPILVWTHVIADGLIASSYLAISFTLTYVVFKAWRDLPFHWILLAFGLFIIACGGTHVMEVLTIWIPVYVLAAAVKLFTAVASVTTAVVLPFVVPRVFTLMEQAKVSEHVTAELRASEERKEALLREVHHRVKNNLAVICSMFYLQSTHTKDEQTIQIFHDMESRVHSMALVHESLYRSENLARINFAEYAQILANDILASHGSPDVPVRLKSDLEPVIMSADLAIPCALILNELISNALKHGFPNGAGGEITVTLRSTVEGICSLCVKDTGIGIPVDLDVSRNNSLGLRLVRSLTQQIRGALQLERIHPGTSAHLQFMVDPYVR
jgi:two-component sensor histidine kinase